MNKTPSKKSLQERSEKRTYLNVSIPEWDGEIACVQSPLASEKDAFEKTLSTIRQSGRQMVAVPNLINVRSRLVVRVLVDPDTHERILSDSAEDVELISKQNAKAVDRIVDAAKELGWTSDDDTKKLEALLKNDPPA